MKQLHKQSSLLFILIGILIGSTFFILQPNLSCLSPSETNPSIPRSFSSVHERINTASFSTDLRNNAGKVPASLGKACDYLNKKKKKNRVKFWKTWVEASKRLEGRLRAVGSVNLDHSWCAAMVDWPASLNRVMILIDIMKWVIPKI